MNNDDLKSGTRRKTVKRKFWFVMKPFFMFLDMFLIDFLYSGTNSIGFLSKSNATVVF